MVDLVNRQVIVFHTPQPDAAQPFSFGYAGKMIYLPGSTVSPLAAPQAAIAVADLLPWAMVAHHSPFRCQRSRSGSSPELGLDLPILNPVIGSYLREPTTMTHNVSDAAEHAHSSTKKRHERALLPTPSGLGGQNGEMAGQGAKQGPGRQISPEYLLLIM